MRGKGSWKAGEIMSEYNRKKRYEEKKKRQEEEKRRKEERERNERERKGI